MAITRRQFVTRLGTLAAAIGVSQLDLAKMTEAFAHGTPWTGLWYNKPQVFWVHGAECTGCSVSLLSLFEDATGNVQGTGLSTVQALNGAVSSPISVANGWSVLGPQNWGSAPTPAWTGAFATNHPFGHKTMSNTAQLTGMDPDGIANGTGGIAGRTPLTVNVADVLIDFIALEYHETVMGMGGDLAYKYLEDAMAVDHTNPFVLVVEGAVQDTGNLGYWNASGSAPWCSIGANGTANATGEAEFGEVIKKLAVRNCAAIITIGQCASFGGYPGCISPVLSKGLTDGKASQTGAQGVFDFLSSFGPTGTRSTDPNATALFAAKDKVIAVPGCPTNPWWFILTVVAWMVDLNAVEQGQNPPLGVLLPGGTTINPAAVDKTRRLKLVYGSSIHGPLCPRYQDFNNGVFAQKPGDPGCLQFIGCKGPATLSLCAVHGWNSTNPQNDPAWEKNLGSITGENGNRASFCISAGHPCMACTEKGYPDNFVPFVTR